MAAYRILAVDDEPALLRLLQLFLGRLGHEVEGCGQASEALARVQTAPGRFDLAICDLSLPDGSGEVLLPRLLAADDRLRILVCSGYPFDPQTLPDALHQRVSFLQKPFSPPMLQASLEELMGTTSA